MSTVINNKVVEFTRLRQESTLVLEYVRKFDQLSRYTLDMVSTEMSKVWRFLSRLCPSLASLVDTGRDNSKSYANAIGCAIRHESWMKIKNKVNPNADEGLNKMTRLNQSQMYWNR